ncbi:zinc finger CCHC domain-containing protein 9-like isoform X1 [Branchiostoma floridae]|uniref:Zinc finger CCHC domain-containing protein 9-like isoform X1 n=1 Tax=Branchiostoma floridae TaxID=7739 RepID=A0A9J7KIV4_BRAFL|nr:zinc finger CCHC domain-containing protein 9-like isoform X1 [Branchiostoma floridae]
MTRFARGGSGNRKRPEEATPWTKLKPRLTGKSSGKKRHGKSPASSTSHSDGGHRSKHPGNNESELMEKELEEALVRTKRSEQRRLKRIKKKTLSKVCYHCRQPGHGMSECPQMTSDVEQGTGICFRCGSTEHKSARCTTRNIPEQTGKYEHKSARCTTRNIPEQTGKRDLPFAKCFTCGETGHLARSCPDNPRGLYPNGEASVIKCACILTEAAANTVDLWSITSGSVPATRLQEGQRSYRSAPWTATPVQTWTLFPGQKSRVNLQLEKGPRLSSFR